MLKLNITAILSLGFALFGWSQTTITFSVDQPESPFEVEAGEDQVFDGLNTVTLGGDATAIGGFGSYSYSWSPSEFLNDPTVANPVVTSLEGSTVFTVTVTDIDGNCIKEDTVMVDLLVSLDELADGRVEVFPNPFDHHVRVNSTLGIDRLVVFDLTGRIVEQMPLGLSTSYQLNTSSYPSGVYFFHVLLSNHQTKMIKLCKGF